MEESKNKITDCRCPDHALPNGWTLNGSPRTGRSFSSAHPQGIFQHNSQIPVCTQSEEFSGFGDLLPEALRVRMNLLV